MTRLGVLAVALVTVVAAPRADSDRPSVSAKVVDASTHLPIANAVVTAGNVELRSDQDGAFHLPSPSVDVIGVRACGYERLQLSVGALGPRNPHIPLKAFKPKALYLSVYGIGDRKLRAAALDLLEDTELNALVIDVKGDRGIIPYRSSIPMATSVGAQNVITISDLAALVAGLHGRGTYVIARIVVFKDTLLASGQPDFAVRRKDGSVFRDNERLSWTNPYSREVWDYNIAVAVEAARAGFDEIQFDYVRLPDARGLASNMAQIQKHRESAIEGFLGAARKVLVPFNVFLAADVFGYVCWNIDDTGIGQRLEHIVAIVDYTSPMLYPSSIQFGIPGYRNHVQHS
jgi:hypothetical protein